MTDEEIVAKLYDDFIHRRNLSEKSKDFLYGQICAKCQIRHHDDLTCDEAIIKEIIE